MQFQDDLAAGVVLVRPALQSPDYVTGVSGWAIKIDGSAEFNNVTIRGGTTVGGTSLYYNGAPAAGNLLASIAGAGGTDPYGNVYVQGLGVYSTTGTIQAVGSELTVTGTNGSKVSLITGTATTRAEVDLLPKDLAGTTWHPGAAYTTLGASSRPATGLSSPCATANPNIATLELYGGGPTTADTYILVGADRVNFNHKIEVTDDCVVSGMMVAANRVVGSVLITPSAANVPTSATVSFGPLTGSTFRGVCSPESAVPGTTVTGWAITSITNTGATVWVTRTNTTQTRIDYIIEGF